MEAKTLAMEEAERISEGRENFAQLAILKREGRIVLWHLPQVKFGDWPKQEMVHYDVVRE